MRRKLGRTLFTTLLAAAALLAVGSGSALAQLSDGAVVVNEADCFTGTDSVLGSYSLPQLVQRAQDAGGPLFPEIAVPGQLPPVRAHLHLHVHEPFPLCERARAVQSARERV